jgi:hypothetical protein
MFAEIDEMQFLPHKESSLEPPSQDRAKPHAYRAPTARPASGHVAFEICGQPPDDFLHDLPKPETESVMHWS